MLLSRLSGVLLVLVPALFFSCGTKKKLWYFQASKDGSVIELDHSFTPTIEIGDVLSIEVTGTDPTVAAPFNQAELTRQGSQMGTYENGVPATYGYLVASDSTVTMPIIGKLSLVGLTRTEAINFVESTLSKYLEKPSVSMRILNFKVTVLGEVKNPGTFSVPNERITILEALGVANDLLITGERSNVLVIRHEDGQKKEFIVDLTKNDVFNSPVYFLKQNDVIYVSPNNRARYNASIAGAVGGTFVSAASVIITTLILIYRY